MLPEERLFRIAQRKQAGLMDLYSQQSNLGGGAFSKEEDPLTSLLGSDFNNKYRQDYADTLTDGTFSGKGRLTSRTGARLLNDLNDMNDRGVAALRGLAANEDRSLSFIKNINNSRIGVGGYTQEQADKDFADIKDKIGLAARLHRTGDKELFNTIAKRYVKGQFGTAINSLKGALGDLPSIAKPFVTDISDEFGKPYNSVAAIQSEQQDFKKELTKARNQTANPKPEAKVTSTTPSGKVDEGTFSAKTDKTDLNDKKQSSIPGILDGLKNMFTGALQGSGNYMLPALLLGTLGGGISKMRGHSFMLPLLFMALAGGAYGIGRHRGWMGNSNNLINRSIDNFDSKTRQYGGFAYNKAKEYTKPVVNRVTQTATSMANSANSAINNTFSPRTYN